MTKLSIPTARAYKPLLAQARYKGAKGGRSSGKSHFFAEGLVEAHVSDASHSSVCIREIQKSLKFSAKRLIEKKIESLGVSHLFDVTQTEIRSLGGDGVMIFQGMQDHTAESIKSLEGFNVAWVEEAQNLSARSLELLLPTIREEGSQVWFSWNPDQETDPVDKLFSDGLEDSILVSANFTDNPFCPQVSINEAERHRKSNPDTYGHVWLGEYNTKSDDQVLSGKYKVEEFKPTDSWDGPYFGADWGFSVDPNTLIECYIHDNNAYIYREAYGLGVEITDTPEFFGSIDSAKSHTIRADSARPEIISYMKSNGYPLIVSVEKWPGSVEDGISTLRGFDSITIHPSCKHTAEEARLWKYKRDRLTGDILPKLIDGNDHCWDAIRYALQPIIKTYNFGDVLKMAMGE